MKKKLYKLFITLLVCLSLGSSPPTQNEIMKLLESLSGVAEANIKELDEEETESGEDNKHLKKNKDVNSD